MTRGPRRRRISPRTKRRYRAIKEFLRRTIGTLSQHDIVRTSSIDISVSDLKNKIVGIDQQLNRVSKHCRNLGCLEHSFRKENLSPIQLQHDEGMKLDEPNITRREKEAKLLYKTSQTHCDSDNVVNSQMNEDDNSVTSTTRAVLQTCHDFQTKPEKTKSRHRLLKNNYANLWEHHLSMQSKYEKQKPIFTASSCHSLRDFRNRSSYSGHRHGKRHSGNCAEPVIDFKKYINRDVKNHFRNLGDSYYDRHDRRKTKDYSHVDKDFINNIINKQYKPVKLFGRRDSNFSQFSAPVCRDQEFTIRDEIQENNELCSCCYQDHRGHNHRYPRTADLSDMRSICDTHLYSSKKHKRNKYTKHYLNDYNDSTLYDVVPIKERSSPKTRRKVAENNKIAFQYYREVPPSPRSHKPRLNLKAQRDNDHEGSVLNQMQKKTPIHEIRRKVNITESDISSDSHYKKNPIVLNALKCTKPIKIQEDVGTMSSLQCPTFVNEVTNASNNDTTFNTQVTNSTANKTDKTLCEIKDILQSFLQEIKKESTHSERSDVTREVENKQVTQQQETNNIYPGVTSNSGQHYHDYSLSACGVTPFLHAIPNPCCCPILPLCPLNGLQNGYIVPSSSHTCNFCAKNSQDPSCLDNEIRNNRSKTCEEMNMNDETRQLIREIYKFVSQTLKSPRTKEDYSNDNVKDNPKKEKCTFDKMVLTTRSVGDSVKCTKRDANVGTPNAKCYSKSCDAIGHRNTSETFNTTNDSYSDTALEKLSLEATHSSLESALSCDAPKRKIKGNKLKNVFHKLKLFKKKNDVVEEQSESESTVEVDVRPKAPFKQHITNYSMHGQEYFHPPPIPEHCFGYPSEFCRYNYDLRCQLPPPSPGCYAHKHPQHEHAAISHCNPAKYAITSQYLKHDPHYHQIPPQMPVCLKEIEVKSMGTQSDRKVSVMQKFTKKMLPQHQQNEIKSNNLTAAKEKPNFWKTLRDNPIDTSPDPLDFSLKTQKKLAQGDLKLRNAMLKKLFYKRNPFSPRNLIVRTILGKDKSSYGDPPKMYKPRMFL